MARSALFTAAGVEAEVASRGARRPVPAGLPGLPLSASPGCVEGTAHLPGGAGWLVSGWTARRWAEAEASEQVLANLSVGTVTGPAMTVFHARPDIPRGAVGFVTLLQASCPADALLRELEMPAQGLRLANLHPDCIMTAAALGTLCRRKLRASQGEDQSPILALLPRPAYDGTDTLAAIWPPVRLEVDNAIYVPPDGLALSGWFLDLGGVVAAMWVRNTTVAVPLDPRTWIVISRPDIVASVGQRLGLDHDGLGFLAYAPGVLGEDGDAFLEVELFDGRVAHRPLRPASRAGLGTLKQILSVQPAPSRLELAFDTILGPLVDGLSRARLARPRRPDVLTFGSLPDAPETSVVITLYGRLDFLEYQLALFSEQPVPGCEILYILDDPRLRADAERLAGSCWSRFRLPFRLLLLDENLGFAPANNVGLRAATGRYVCLLNSDVFPTAGNGLAWLPRLTRHLQADPTLGMVAPLLLYEDGTVQHRGMHFERLPGHPNWDFPIHTGKGAPAPELASLTEVEAVTGACMVLRRTALLALGGLDEGYVIGDFEDAHLCQQLRADGLRCAVDFGTRLYHLERQSQGEAQPWRGNATLFNAWRHHRLWGSQNRAAR